MDPSNRKTIMITALLILLFGAVGIYSLANNSDSDNDNSIQPVDLKPVDTVIDIIAPSDTLARFLDATTKTGLDETLRGSDEYTIFAPIDTAFAALPDGTLDTLFAEQNRAQLTDVVEYHTVQGSLKASDLSDGETLETLHGGTLQVRKDGDSVSITDGSGASAQIISVDLEATNGYVHVIDTVLTP